jgi:hypothetical protein
MVRNLQKRNVPCIGKKARKKERKDRTGFEKKRRKKGGCLYVRKTTYGIFPDFPNELREC